MALTVLHQSFSPTLENSVGTGYSCSISVPPPDLHPSSPGLFHCWLLALTPPVSPSCSHTLLSLGQLLLEMSSVEDSLFLCPTNTPTPVGQIVLSSKLNTEPQHVLLSSASMHPFFFLPDFSVGCVKRVKSLFSFCLRLQKSLSTFIRCSRAH